MRVTKSENGVCDRHCENNEINVVGKYIGKYIEKWKKKNGVKKVSVLS